MCMYAYIYVCECMHISMYAGRHTCVYTATLAYIQTDVYLPTYIPECTQSHKHAYIQKYMLADSCMYYFWVYM